MSSGRNLPAAIATGVGLLALVVASLLWRKEIFIAVAGIAVSVAMYELSVAFRRASINLPLIPLIVGVFGILISAYALGPEGLLLSSAMTVAAAVVWRLFEGGGPAALRDVSATMFATAYLPFLGGFLMLMLAVPDGHWRVLFALLFAAANDTGGFFVGSRFGRHPMAPKISPKKSWEGFAGSYLLALAAPALVAVLVFKAEWWVAFILAAIAVVMGTFGDFSESLIKRNLDMKDMGSVLPGHGGLMDRLDSVLVSAPAFYLAFEAFLPTMAA